MLRPRPSYVGPRAYYGLRWVGPRYYGRGYYGRGLMAAATTVVAGGGNYSGRRPSKASCSNARMPSRVIGRGL